MDKLFEAFARKKEPDPVPRYYPNGKGGYFEFIGLSNKSAEVWRSAILDFGGGFEYCEEQPEDKKKLNVNIQLPWQWNYENLEGEARRQIQETLFSKVDEIRNRGKK